MKIFGVTVPSPKELEEKTRKVMEACERYQRGECDCTASSALTQCEVDALLAGCVDECGGDDLEEGGGAIGQSHNAGGELDDETAISLGKELVALSSVCQTCHGEGIEGDEPNANG